MLSSLQNVTFYGILDTGYVAPENWIAKYDALAEGGAGIVQIRAKRETSSERERLLAKIVEHRAHSSASVEQPLLVINDDLALCLKYETVGLHVGQDDTPAKEAREQIGPDRILGLSTHSKQQALQALELGADILSYFAVGPVFPTQTKPDYQAVGLELVRFVADQQPSLPFFCIGGINRSNIARVRDAGGMRIVAVSDALCDPNTANAVRQSIVQMTLPR